MKRKFWIVPAIVAGLVLSVHTSLVYAQACTISTVAGNGENLSTTSGWFPTGTAEVATEVGIADPWGGPVDSYLRIVNVDHSGNAVFSVRYPSNIPVRITESGGLQRLPNSPGCEDFSFARDGDLYCLGFISGRTDWIGRIVRYPADGGPAEEFNVDELLAYSEGGIAVDSSENLYFASGVVIGDQSWDRMAYQIKKRTPEGVISIIADGSVTGFDGSGEQEALGAIGRNPFLLMTSDNSDNIYAQTSRGIRRISPSGAITTISGLRGSGIAASDDGTIFLANYNEHQVKKILPDGSVMTFAGNGTPGFAGDDGPALEAQLKRPFDVAVDSDGIVYIADEGNARIRKVTCPQEEEADLSVTVSSIVLRGRLIFYAVVRNNGPDEAVDISVVHTLPSGYSVSNVFPVSSCTGLRTNAVVCTFNRLRSGQARRTDISFEVPSRGTSVTDSVMVSSPTTDPNPANNSLSRTRTIR